MRKWRSHRYQTLLSIALLGVCTAFTALSISLSQAAEESPAILSVSPATGTMTMAQEIPVDIRIDTAGHRVTAVRLELLLTDVLLFGEDATSPPSDFPELLLPPTPGTTVVIERAVYSTGFMGAGQVTRLRLWPASPGPASVSILKAEVYSLDSVVPFGAQQGTFIVNPLPLRGAQSVPGGGGGGGNLTSSSNLNGPPDPSASVSETAPSSELAGMLHPAAPPLECAVLAGDDGEMPLEFDGSFVLSLADRDILYWDVPVSAWYTPYVATVMKVGYMRGYADAQGRPLGEYGPGSPVTYGELAKIAASLGHIDASAHTAAPHNRSATRHWSAPYIAAMESAGSSIFTALPDVQKIANRAAVVQTILDVLRAQIPARVETSRYRDVRATSTYAAAIQTATELGLVQGDDIMDTIILPPFRPDAPMNRAEIATLLTRALRVRCFPSP